MRLQFGFLLAPALGSRFPLSADVLLQRNGPGQLGPLLDHRHGINNAGQVTGLSDISTGAYRAFLYSNGQMTDLGTLGGRDSVGQGLNNAGQVTGYSLTATAEYRAFLYSNGQMTDLGTLGGSGGNGSFGASRHNAGQVAGRAE